MSKLTFTETAKFLGPGWTPADVKWGLMQKELPGFIRHGKEDVCCVESDRLAAWKYGADLRPAGQWYVKELNDGSEVWECSGCHYETEPRAHQNFCPKCGQPKQLL
ncbi:MAG: hypothetical protein IKS39_06900 [Clostridia bacterium]|nr:hypothetical protein [Clostridia bacterium]